MEVWHIWVIAALIFFVIEMFTSDFSIICLSFGCFGAAIGAACDVELKIQLLIFSIATLLAFALIRPALKKLLSRNKKEVPTNADALIGRHAIVSEAINPATQQGRVAIDGDDWKAVSEDNTPIEKGSQVEVVSRNSIVLTVKKL
ncbi:MAG: NfeD family protein [Alistipes sp.]|nr:NfeD family protein [Alistipes sp.]